MDKKIAQSLYETLKSAKESYDMVMDDLPLNTIAKGAIGGAFITVKWSVIDEYEKNIINSNVSLRELAELKELAQQNVKLAKIKNSEETYDNYLYRQCHERLPDIIQSIKELSSMGVNETFGYPDLNKYEVHLLEQAGFKVTVWEREMEPNKAKISWEPEEN